MKLNITYDKKELEQLIKNDIAKRIDINDPGFESLKILVKSKQNYKSEWEDADYIATYNADIS